MNKMTCEMCGGKDIIKNDGVFVCNTCGCKYSLEEAKKLVGVVIDNSNLISGYISKADEYYNNNELQKSLEYYKKVLLLDPLNEHATLREKELSRTVGLDIITIDPDKSKNLDVKKYFKREGIYLNPKLIQNFEFIKHITMYIGVAVYSIDGSTNYSGTACFKKSIPYNDIEYETAYTNGQCVRVKKEVVRYRDEEDKRPFNGSINFNLKSIKVLNPIYLLSESVFRPIIERNILTNHNNIIKGIENDDLNSLIYDYNTLKPNFDSEINNHTNNLLYNVKQGDRCENFSHSENYNITSKKLLLFPFEKIYFNSDEEFYIFNSLSYGIDYKYSNCTSSSESNVDALKFKNLNDLLKKADIDKANVFSSISEMKKELEEIKNKKPSFISKILGKDEKADLISNKQKDIDLLINKMSELEGNISNYKIELENLENKIKENDNAKKIEFDNFLKRLDELCINENRTNIK